MIQLSYTVGSRFATVRFTTIHFYEPCRVGPSTPELVVHHCRNSRVLSLLSALLALFRGVCVFLILFYGRSIESIVIFPSTTSIKKTKKEEKIKRVDVTFFLYVF